MTLEGGFGVIDLPRRAIVHTADLRWYSGCHVNNDEDGPGGGRRLHLDARR